jgi:hypothetical protein
MKHQWILSIAGVGFLVVVALAGCSSNSQPASVVNPAVAVAPANNYTTYSTEEEPAYGTRPPVRTISPQQVDAQPPYPQQSYADAPQQYYADRPNVEPRTRVITRRRSFGHSAAIVGGSAGVGAAIGALAGGGKGAGIGALAAGGAGFIYDRLTHKKREVVVER